MDRQVVVSDYRQTGRTEKIIWMCVGSILEGGRPTIITRSESDRSQTKSRLTQALERVGYPTIPAHTLANQCVPINSREVHGRGLTFKEADYF